MQMPDMPTMPDMGSVFKIKTAMLFLSGIVVYSLIYFMLPTGYLAGVNNYTDCLYFSSTTMTHIGYGDMVPLNRTAKMLIMSQQIVSVLILFCLVGTN